MARYRLPRDQTCPDCGETFANVERHRTMKHKGGWRELAGKAAAAGQRPQLKLARKPAPPPKARRPAEPPAEPQEPPEPQDEGAGGSWADRLLGGFL